MTTPDEFDDTTQADTAVAPEDQYAVDPEAEGEPTDEPFVYDEDVSNLAEAFDAHPDGKKALQKLGNKVVDDFDSDYESSTEWRERIAADWKLFAGDLPEKLFPWKDAANVHVPLMLENITRVVFRAYGELFQDKSNVFGVSSLGPEDDDQAALLGLHGNWQLRNEIPDFFREIGHRSLLNFFTVGDITGHSYYDEVRKQNRHELLTADEFVTPYAYKTTMPDYSDLPRMTKVMRKYKNQVEAMRAVWFDIDTVLDDKPSFDDDPESPIAQSAAETAGVEMPDDDGAAPYKILWYEGWVDLPNQTRERFCKILVDYRTHHVLSLTVQEEAPWQDKAKYKRQIDELAKFRNEQAAHQQALAEHDQMGAQLGEATAAGSVGPEQAAQTLQTLQATAPQPPVPPAWMENPDDPTEAPKQPDKRPIRLFVHAVCIEPAGGSLGLGYGRGQADHNRSANTAFSQFTDAATLANCKTVITSGNAEWEGGTFKIAPGAINRMSGVSPDEVKNGIIPFAFGDANPALLQIVQDVKSDAEGAIQGPSVLSGESGKSGETARGISARIEQATKQLSVVTGKFADEFLTNILKNNAYLNSIFLPDEELFQMEANLVPPGLTPPFKIGREMYARNYQIEIRADLRFATQAQRVGEADDALNLIKAIPQWQGNDALCYALTKKCLEARGLRDLIPMLGPAPPVPVTPMGRPPPPPAPPPPPPGAPPLGTGGPPGPGGPMPPGMIPPGGPHGPPPGPTPRPPPQLPGAH